MEADHNVLTYKDGRPIYELSGTEIAFPQELDGGIYVYFYCDAQVEPGLFYKALDELPPKFRSSDVTAEREWDIGSDMEARRFVDAHFRGIGNVEGDPTFEEQRAFLDERPALKARIFTHGYNLIVSPKADEAPTGKLKLGNIERAVEARRFLYSPAEDRIEIVDLKHLHRRATEEDRIRYKRTLRILDRGRTQTIRTDWRGIESLYDGLVTGIEGALVNGEPCTEENKDSWLRRVMLIDKVFAVGRIFSATAIKNG